MNEEKLYLTYEEIQQGGYLFNSDKEIAEYLGANGYQKSALYEKNLLYCGTASGNKLTHAQVVGKVNDFCCIIKVGDQFIKIHVDYLNEMQKKYYFVTGEHLYHAPETYVLLDVETTGLSIIYDKITEIAALKVVNHEIVDTFHVLVNPKRKIQKKVVELNKLTNEMLKDAPTIEEVENDFVNFISDYPLVGFNIERFDNAIITEVFRRNLENDYYDFYERLVKNSEEFESLKDKKVKSIMKSLDMGEEEHRALQDCFDEYVIYEYLVSKREPKRILATDYKSGESKDNNMQMSFDFDMVDCDKEDAEKEPIEIVEDVNEEETQDQPLESVEEIDEDEILEDVTLTGETLEPWQKETIVMLNELVKKHELPDNSLYLAGNRSWKTGEIKSYSICIYEQEFPAIPQSQKDQKRNSVVLRILTGRNVRPPMEYIDLLVKTSIFESCGEVECDKITRRKSEPNVVRIRIDKNKTDVVKVVEYLQKVTEYKLKYYDSKAATFGCCSQFEKCSDAKKCVHENKLYSMACSYRRHLEEGRIFYGKNRNVE